MKFKHLFFYCMMAIAFATNAQTDSTVITFNIRGFNSGTAKILGVYADQNYLADTAIIDNNGSFTFRRKNALEPGLFYVLMPDKTNFQIMIPERTGQFFTVTGVKDDMVQSLKSEGSIDNDLLFKLARYQVEIEPKFNEVTSRLNRSKPGTPEYDTLKMEQTTLLSGKEKKLIYYNEKWPNSLTVKFKWAGQNPTLVEPLKANGTLDTILYAYQYRARFWENVDCNDARLLRTPVFFNKLKRYMGELTPQNPDSIIASADYIIQKTMGNPELFKFTSNWIALQYQAGKTSMMDGEQVYAHIVMKYFTKELAFWSNDKEIKGLREQASYIQNSKLGNIGQDVRIKDISGTYRNLYDLKTDYLIVYIYNPDCSHCKEESPVLAEKAREWAANGTPISVYAIATNTTDEEWRAYQKLQNFPFWNTLDPSLESNWFMKYQVDNTPELYILNKERKIIGKNLKVKQIMDIVERDMRLRK